MIPPSSVFTVGGPIGPHSSDSPVYPDRTPANSREYLNRTRYRCPTHCPPRKGGAPLSSASPPGGVCGSLRVSYKSFAAHAHPSAVPHGPAFSRIRRARPPFPAFSASFRAIFPESKPPALPPDRRGSDGAGVVMGAGAGAGDGGGTGEGADRRKGFQIFLAGLGGGGPGRSRTGGRSANWIIGIYATDVNGARIAVTAGSREGTTFRPAQEFDPSEAAIIGSEHWITQ